MNNLWWIRNLFSKRHDGYIFDGWDDKYPTFKASRREMIRLHIRIHKQTKKHV